MAQLYPDAQEFVDMRNGTVIGIHHITKMSSSDTLRVPDLAARSTFANSVAQLRDEDEASLTLTGTNKNTVTITSGTVGNKYVIVTRHGRNLNFGDDDSNSPPLQS